MSRTNTQPNKTRDRCNRCGRPIKHARRHPIFGVLGTGCYTKVAALPKILSTLGMQDHHNNETLFPATKAPDGTWAPSPALQEFMNKSRAEKLQFNVTIIPDPNNPERRLAKLTISFNRSRKRKPPIKSYEELQKERLERMQQNRAQRLAQQTHPQQTSSE